MTRPSKVVRLAPVKEPVSSKDIETSSIENTPSPIPTRRVSMPGSKQHPTSEQSKPKTTKALKQHQPETKKLSKEEAAPMKTEGNWRIDVSNIIPTSRKTRGQLKNNEVNESPRPKRRRLSRQQGQAQPVYSQQWHPMDDVMSLKRDLKGKAKACSPQKADEDEGDVSDGREKIDAYDVDSEVDRGDQTGMNEDNDNDGEVTPSVHCSPISDRRRSTRTSMRANVPNYDMRFHPAYDEACRPAAAQAATLRQTGSQKPRRTFKDTNATLVQDGAVTAGHDVTVNDKGPTVAPSPAPKLSYSKILCVAIPELPEDSTHSPTRVPESNKALLSSPPPWSNLQDPHVFTKPLDYQKLELLDRLIYSIQKGAPSHGDILPTTWQDVKRVLFDYGEITLDELNSEEGTEWLKARYENVRHGIEAFFGIEGSEPSDKNDWTLCHIEGFDVFDKQRGSRYWKNRRHSVVGATTIKVSYRETGEVAETDDEGDIYRGGHQFNIYEDAVGSGSAAASVVEAVTPGANKDSIEGDTLINLPDAGSVVEDHEHTLIENMRGAEALSSEPMMDEEELGKLLSPIAQHLKEPPLSHLPSRKRKSRSETEPQVSIHEDLPGGTPKLKRAIANNPPSLGTDIPKENLYENGTVDHSSQDSITTPRTRR